MKHKLFLVILATVVCLCGCSFNSSDNVEEVTEEDTAVEETTEIESVITTETEVETESIEETSEEESSTVEEIVEDGITYYNYGYDIPTDINIGVVDGKVQISTDSNGPDFYNDKFDVYYWIDRNTKIFDSTSMEVKQNVPALVFTKDNFNSSWSYLWLIGGDGVIVESSYQLRVLEVSFVKDGEQCTGKYILCCPKGALFFNHTLDNNTEFTNVLDINYEAEDLTLDLNDLILNKSTDCIEVECEKFKALAVSYDALINSYENYTKLVSFYSESIIDPQPEYSIQMPLDAATLNETLLSNLKVNVQSYIDSVLAGTRYYYIILDDDGNLYEIIVASNTDIDVTKLSFGDSLFVDDDTYTSINGDTKISWCQYDDFINNEEINNKVISYVSQ